ncbi:hypothetical protein FQN52_000065 [Onygenales sp. PD_12]|nr:hypothetical protein FQN52_000065 [Onygenales sp. PD_12]
MAGPSFLDFTLTSEAERALRQVRADLYVGIISLLVPTIVLYISLYALARRQMRSFAVLSVLASVGFVISGTVTVLDCSMVRSLQYFAVAIGLMKSLDLFVRRHDPPTYAYHPRPSAPIIALLYLTELRYESFHPNHVRIGPVPAPSPEKEPTGRKRRTTRRTPKTTTWKPQFSERVNLVLHGAFFTILQTLFPQYPAVQALEVLLAIYVIWEFLQLVLRYHDSPPLFGPLYTATSLGTFWSETWHSAFASPCRSLAYDPLRRALPERYGVPDSISRAVGVIASFSLMGLFHVYGLRPLLPFDALARIYAFFLMNGFGTVIEDAIWGRETHWGKTILAWVFELGIASWTVEGLSVPKGLRDIQWSSICDVGRV